MAKTGKDDDKPIVPDRDGPSPLDYNVDSEKALIAFRETVSRRERGTEVEKIDTFAPDRTPESAHENAGIDFELNNAGVAKAFQALTRAPRTLWHEKEQTPEHFHLPRPGRSR